MRRTIFELDTKNDERKYYKFGVRYVMKIQLRSLVRRFRKDGADFYDVATTDALVS